MVEGMVMELYNNHVVVMTKSGEFIRLKKRGIVNIGDIYKESVYRKIPKFTYAAAAALIFVFTSFAGYTAYANQIVGYVDIKGSKDVRLYVNRKGTVQKVDGLQNANQIKNLPVSQAVEELNAIAPAEGIYNDSSEVDVITTKVKDSKLDFKQVNENVKEILSKENKNKDKNPDKTKPDNSSKENKPNDSKNNNGNGNVNNNNNNNNKDNNSKQDNKDVNKAKDTDKSKDTNNTKNDDKKVKSSSKNINFYQFDTYSYFGDGKKDGFNSNIKLYKKLQ